MTWGNLFEFRVIARTVGMHGTKDYYTRKFEKESAGMEIFNELKESLLDNGFIDIHRYL
jgi:hypothetical protein